MLGPNPSFKAGHDGNSPPSHHVLAPKMPSIRHYCSSWLSAEPVSGNSRGCAGVWLCQNHQLLLSVIILTSFLSFSFPILSSVTGDATRVTVPFETAHVGLGEAGYACLHVHVCKYVSAVNVFTSGLWRWAISSLPPEKSGKGSAILDEYRDETGQSEIAQTL